MLRGILKNVSFIFFFAIFISFFGQSEAHSKTIVRYDINFSCADNAVAPLNSIKDIQTFLNCNGFSPGPIDGVAGGRTEAAIKSFQSSVGPLWQSNVPAPPEGPAWRGS